MSEDKSISHNFGRFGLLIILGLLQAMFRGFVAYKVWGWHAVPTLEAPVIGYFAMCGLVYVVSSFVYRVPYSMTRDSADGVGIGKDENRDNEMIWSETTSNIFLGLLVLLGGWVFSLLL